MQVTTPEFKEAYKQLNNEQKAAVDAIEGPVMVIAGPGTGKTQVLTLRIANILLKTDTRPEQILALTFTDNAATNMRKRLANIIGTPAYKVRITTFHSFCNDIIQKYPEFFPRVAGAQSSTEVESVSIIEELVHSLPLTTLRPWGDPNLYIRDILKKIEELKREGLDPEEFTKKIDEAEKRVRENPDLYHEKGAYKGRMKLEYQEYLRKIEKNRELALIYKNYQDKLNELRLYDFSDMILEVLKALKNGEKEKSKNENILENDLKLTLQEEYQYILVDEHQDTNSAQNQILELLSDFHQNPNIFVVGDVKQAIFRFQGASMENFLYFTKKYPGSLLVELFRNYRSTQHILDTAHSLIKSETELKSHATAQHDPKLPENKVKVASFRNEGLEHYWIADEIKRRKERKKERLEDGKESVAIIYRENKDAFPISIQLQKSGISFIIESDEDIFSEKFVRKFISLLYAVNFYGDPNYLVDVLHIEEFGIDPLDAYKLFKRANDERISVYDATKTGVIDEIFRLMKGWAKQAKEGELTELLETVLKESGLLRAMITSRDADAFLGLERLFEEAKKLSYKKGGARLSDLIRHIELIKEHGLFIKRPKNGGSNDAVRLMTAHRAKGLEFDTVFIANATDSSFGPRARRDRLPLISEVYTKGGSATDDRDSEDDERRLFYVALTRAKKQIYITYPNCDVEGKETLPSPFILELRKDRVEEVDTTRFEEEINQDKSVLFVGRGLPPMRQIDKEFVLELWGSHPLSVTALNNYLECPWKYFYRNLLRIPEVQKKHLVYGSAMHAAVEEMFKSKVSKEKLIEAFKKRISNSILSEAERQEAALRGESALSVWFEERHASWRNPGLNEYEVRAVDLDGVLLSGKLDRVELLGNDRVAVTDFKTGKPKSRNVIDGKTKDSHGDMKRQLVFYKLLLDLEKRYKMTKGAIEFLEPTPSTGSGQVKRGRIKIEEFEIRDDEVTELRQMIKKMAGEITTLSFWDKACGEKDCEWCGYRKLLQDQSR